MKHLLFAFSFILFLSASSQELPKKLLKESKKLEGYYISGEYKDYISSIDKFIAFYQSETGNEAKLHEGHYHVLKGKGLLGMGNSLTTAEAEMQKGLQLITSVR